MIDRTVTPLASATLATGSTVEGGPESSGSPNAIEVTLPTFLHEELSQVAQSEDCEISDIVLNALDQYLADHWVRS